MPAGQADGAPVRTLRVSVPASHPGFAGHFPGSPVLPGVVQIGLVLEALGEAGAAPPRVAGIPSVRFRAVVVPGDVLDVRATGPGPDGRVGFEIRRGETLVSHGALVVEAA